MYTSVMAVALGLFGTVDADSLRWSGDYSTASRQGVEQKKPLAVVLGSGEAGWEKLSREGKLGKDAKDILSSQYVLLYIDTETEEGKRMARAFEIQGSGLVISDRTGEKQAFRHEGSLAGEDLTRALKKYADPNVVVYTTQTNASERRSYYGPTNGGSSPQFRFGGVSGQNC